MKRIMLASMIAAAAMFTACDDDSSSSSDVKTYSCDINADMGVLGSVRVCAEASDQTKMSDVCGKAGEAFKAMGAEDAAKSGTGCPNGAKKQCSGKLDGVDFTAFYYTDEDVEASCDDLLKQIDQIK